ncbi:hypothetical protein SASPL_133627 [Salvia splendens]|uniref:Mei2-like C-terminal RNA recognition motif domain-containing protein n=1 Tax=Salvia splendens TaxID=180675 RepID=A0A8X8ZII3_SALSN|nr:uncharacterized protein LOC121757730 [Salvia splendens]KAG6406031.1 hypothetical protein SASPL_133627 [Salvia splendens]
MCFKSCKSSPLLRPTPPLNPKAEEWRPTRLNHIPSPPHKLLWHIPPQSHCYQYHPVPYLQRSLPHFIYHSSSPPPPPIQVKNASEKLDCSIVKQGLKSGVTKPPRNKEASLLTHHFSSSSSRTTVMLRNIPNQLRSKDNLGYAFVNFTKGGDALKFKKIVQGFKWGPLETDKGIFTSRKFCAITWARIQGKEKLVKRFESSTFGCDNPEFLPVVFDPPRGGSSATSPVVVGRLINQVRS